MAENFVNVTEGSGKKLHTFNKTIGANDVHDEVVLEGEQYLASYAVATAAVSIATAADHVLQIMAGASLKVRIRRIEVFQRIAVTTGGFGDLSLYRLTTAGTGGTTVTARPLDPADAAAGATGMTLPTAKGTEGVLIATAGAYFLQTATASLSFPQPVMVFDFDLPRMKPLVIAAGTANGIALKTPGMAGGSVSVMAYLTESSF